ncbi:MAG: 3'-5' exonuclease [Lentisphaeraceae bacterium]|nr:3'-5' exonuclease [Lentisphaeraceae bacterium]
MFYCIDFESTGAANGQEPLEFAWVSLSIDGKFENHREIGFEDVKGGRELSFNETYPHLRDAWPLIEKNLHNQVLVGHNVSYDHALLVKTFPAFKSAGLIDTLTLYRQLYDKQIDDYSLSSLMSIFQLGDKIDQLVCNDHFEPHRAMYDSYACGLLLQRLLQDETTRSIFFHEEKQGELF